MHFPTIKYNFIYNLNNPENFHAKSCGQEGQAWMGRIYMSLIWGISLEKVASYVARYKLSKFKFVLSLTCKSLYFEVWHNV